jgi:hypothetical protein
MYKPGTYNCGSPGIPKKKKKNTGQLSADTQAGDIPAPETSLAYSIGESRLEVRRNTRTGETSYTSLAMQEANQVEATTPLYPRFINQLRDHQIFSASK